MSAIDWEELATLGAAATSHDDTTAEADVPFEYRVVAEDGADETPSNVDTATLDA